MHGMGIFRLATGVGRQIEGERETEKEDHKSNLQPPRSDGTKTTERNLCSFEGVRDMLTSTSSTGFPCKEEAHKFCFTILFREPGRAGVTSRISCKAIK